MGNGRKSRPWLLTTNQYALTVRNEYVTPRGKTGRGAQKSSPHCVLGCSMKITEFEQLDFLCFRF